MSPGGFPSPLPGTAARSDPPRSGPPPSPQDRVLPNPEESGIDVRERVTRIGMEGNHWLHPDYTDRELRMLADIGSLVEWARDVLPVLKRHGIDYLLMPDELRRIGKEHGPWLSD